MYSAVSKTGTWPSEDMHDSRTRNLQASKSTLSSTFISQVSICSSGLSELCLACFWWEVRGQCKWILVIHMHWEVREWGHSTSRDLHKLLWQLQVCQFLVEDTVAGVTWVELYYEKNTNCTQWNVPLNQKPLYPGETALCWTGHDYVVYCFLVNNQISWFTILVIHSLQKVT